MHDPRRHEPRVTAVVLTCLLLFVAACSEGTKSPSPTTSTTPVAQLDGRIGAFALAGADGLTAAADAGLDLTLTTYPSDQASARTLRQRDIAILDSTVQRLIYSRMCSGSTRACRPPTSPEWAGTLDEVRSHVESVGADPQLAGFYLLDDYRAGAAPLLREVRQLLAELAPGRPTVCGFSLNLAQGNRTPKLAAFDRALSNYSPQWCDDVLIYSYVPGSTTPRTGIVDWDMSLTLEPALDRLRKAGWDSSRSRLLGTPQAVGYNPRYTIGSRRITPEYRVAPSGADMAAQVRAFCAAGASAIIAYAWDDGSTGVVDELHNSPELREALTSAGRACLPAAPPR